MGEVIQQEKEVRGKVVFKKEIGFLLVHLAPLLVFWTGVTSFDWILCISLYFIRMFFVTGGYHRYFSHSTYKTSRFVQFLIAFWAETSLQKGVLHWAANHRTHHRYSDTPKDPHSKKIYGFWYSHIGWIIGPDYKETKLNLIKDFAKYPELLWLNKYHLIPPLTLLIGVFLVGGYVNASAAGVEISIMSIMSHGLSSLVIGFFLSTVILFHGTFSINSLMHMIGRKRYESNDESKNNLVLALITLGEGWHNNHHYYQSTVRQGFYWWEIDITFYILKFFSWFGIVWDLKPVPKHIKDSRTKEEAKKLKLEYLKLEKN
ncbi:MAG: acyl-CoA desaturase [Crocinitomix sp.]|nr:acyl-CoA desaturase [Crocinitomix sp.]